MPGVSIIISTYNQARFITETVDSALGQIHRPLEVIVVDDGSTDGTRQVLVPYLDRIAYIHQENQGLAAARNTGFRASHEEYLLFLDSDDCIPADKCSRQAAALDAQPELALVYSAWQQVSEDGLRVLGESHPGFEGQVLQPLLLRRFFFFASSALLRRSAIERVGLFDETLPWGEDADFWLRLALAGYSFGYLDTPLLRYRVHDQSMTARVSQAQVRGWLAVLEKFYATPGLTAEIQALRGEAKAVLHFETAGRFFREGSIATGQEQLRLAVCPPAPEVEPDWFLEWLAGTALDPRTPDPEALIERVFAALPAEAVSLRRLRGRAYARYQAAAAFAAFRAHDLAGVRRRLIPALAGDPRLLANRGLLSIAWKALFSQGFER